MRLSGPELVRIAITLAMLIALLMLTKPCSNAVSTFVMGMDGSAKNPVAKPGTIDPNPYEHLKPGMTDAEIRSAIERAKSKGAAPSSRGDATAK